MSRVLSDLYSLKKANAFDEKFYAELYPDLENYKLPLLFHYVMHGSNEGRSPCRGFDAAEYLKLRKDVAERGLNPLVHYLKFGINEQPSSQRYAEEMERKNRALEEKSSIISALEAREGALSASLEKKNSIISALEARREKPENFPVANVQVLMEEERYQDALVLLRSISYEKENICHVDLLRAILESRVNGWAESVYYWNELERRKKEGAYDGEISRYVNLLGRDSAEGLFESIEPVLGVNERQDDGTYCVYTTLFGESDALAPIPDTFSRDIRYICFTDETRDAAGWEYVVCKPTQKSDNLSAKLYKVLPFSFLKNFDGSLFVDANTEFLNDPADLIYKYLSHEPWVMFEHPDRCGLYQEAAAIITSAKCDAEGVVRQTSAYEEKGYFERQGLCEASFLWRRHDSPELRDFMEIWWEHILNYTHRDQLSLAFLFFEIGLRPKVLSKKFGTSRRNHYFYKTPHIATNHNDLLAEIAKKSSNNIAFLYSDRYIDTASTQMRAKNFLNVLENFDARGLNYSYTSSLDQTGRGLFLTKGVLQDISPEQLAKLQAKNWFIAADYVDALPREDLAPFIDVYIASSIAGYIRYRTRFPNKLAFRLDHLVDHRLKAATQQEYCRVGYFGELANAKYKEDLAGQIDFHSVNTKSPNDDWLGALPKYNVHYCIRSARSFDGDKPFLKGFTAAHCNSLLLVNRDEGDVLYMLSPEYPYFCEPTLESIEETLSSIAAQWGKEEFTEAHKLVAKLRIPSSNESVVKQWYCLLEKLAD